MNAKFLIPALLLMAVFGAAYVAAPLPPQATLAKVLACESIAETIELADVKKLIESLGAQTDERTENIGWYTLPNPIKVLGHDVSVIGIYYNGNELRYVSALKNGEWQTFIQALQLKLVNDGDDDWWWERVEGKRKIFAKEREDNDDLDFGCFLQK
jgi:hypothetical protein